LTRLCQHLGRIDNIDCAFLKLYGVTTGQLGLIDQALGNIKVAIVIDSDLGNDEGPFRQWPRQESCRFRREQLRVRQTISRPSKTTFRVKTSNHFEISIPPNRRIIRLAGVFRI
jgi:hypothetical protein